MSIKAAIVETAIETLEQVDPSLPNLSKDNFLITLFEESDVLLNALFAVSPELSNLDHPLTRSTMQFKDELEEYILNLSPDEFEILVEKILNHLTRERFSLLGY